MLSCRGRHETDDITEERVPHMGSKKQTSLSTGPTCNFLVVDPSRDGLLDYFKTAAPRDESQAQMAPGMKNRNGYCGTCGQRPCEC